MIMPSSSAAAASRKSRPQSAKVALGSRAVTSTKSSSDELALLRNQLAALSKTQGVIEFNLDGTVLAANPPVLATLGYTLEEIKGQSHTVLVDPATRESAGYKQLWQDLAAGPSHTGEAKHLRKDGTAVWIQASYQPVLNAAGRPAKILAAWVDVTAQHAVALEMAELKVRAEITNMTSIVSESDLKGDILNINEKSHTTAAAVINPPAGA